MKTAVILKAQLLLSNQVAMALFIGRGPIFILCLFFRATRALFQRRLLYGIGTMFSMVALAGMVIRVAGTFWIAALADKFLLDGALADGMTSMALQQGGMGLILTTLILTAPPMAAMFFQGTLGAFMAYSQIGGSPGAAAPGPQGQPPGSYAPQQAAPASTAATGETAQSRVVMPNMGGEAGAGNVAPAGSRGNAPIG
ncbi:TrbL/VirB6 plasmid conjugal transfer protein [Stenotrophomonas chelatiphaga]|uniref:TrbL/VirB6 plasmid conjugal transfer protein n=1 Tax=Stenotrophomonas chelatiphaga TaxID=517011 RepID=A0A0R0CD64_9GAMM|nr:TrbL/VirB6 plasmid conjugal transfer protein [Stenotrophomonas chelatiphaga]